MLDFCLCFGDMVLCCICRVQDVAGMGEYGEKYWLLRDSVVFDVKNPTRPSNRLSTESEQRR